MTRKDGSFIKTERLHQISHKIKEDIKEGVDYNRILDWIEFNIGLRRDTAQDYLDKIIRVEGWVITNGYIKAEL